jgi:hypothetical protein
MKFGTSKYRLSTLVKRGIMLLNDKVVDTNVMRLKRTVAKYEHVIVVEAV